MHDRDSVLILDVEIPLTPSVCMCSSVSAASNSITVPTFPGITAQRSCHPDTSSCKSFDCDVTVQSSVYHSRVAIDPCTEVVEVNVDDSTGESIFHQLFSQSQSMPLNVGSSSLPIHPVLYVTLQHFMYSMNVSVSCMHCSGWLI